MVYHHNEHRSTVYTTPPTAIQRELVPNHFRDLFRPQPLPFRPLQRHILLALPLVSSNLSRRASTSTPKLVPGNVSCGVGEPHQYDGLGMRAGVGSRHGYICLGIMVD